MGGEQFGAGALSLTWGDPHAPGSDACELLGLEEVYLSTFERINHVRREIRQPQVVVYETAEGDLRECFTVEDILQSSCYPEKVFALPFSRPTAFRVSSGVALRMPGCPEQAHQLFIFLRDEVGQCLVQFLDDGADCLK
jgi:hypothetical protein